MKYWYDTEFLEDGKTIDLISFAIIAEDGREYYAVNCDADWERIKKHPWLCENVIPNLPRLGNESYRVPEEAKYVFHINTRDVHVKPRFVIRNEIREFFANDPDVELWGYYSAYDHVALAQLFGPMINLPDGIPMWTNDIRQLAHTLGAGTIPIPNPQAHDALADARWTRDAHQWLTTLQENQK